MSDAHPPSSPPPPPPSLPAEATDHGSRIVVAPDKGARSASIAVAVMLLLFAALVAAVFPRLLPDRTTEAFALVGALVLVALAVLLSRSRRVEFDQAGVTMKGALRTRHLGADRVAGVTVERRSAWTRTDGTTRRLPGGVTVSVGSRNHSTSTRVETHYVEVHFASTEGGRGVTVPLNTSEVRDGWALATVLAQRGWLPAGVDIAIQPPP